MHRSIPPDLDDLAGRLPGRPVPRTLALLVAGVLAAGVGWWLLRPAGRPVEATIPLASGAATASSVATSGGAADPVVGSAPSGGAAADGATAWAAENSGTWERCACGDGAPATGGSVCESVTHVSFLAGVGWGKGQCFT